MTMVKYAIVIPAYKAADTIAETLQSIAACQPEINQALAVYLVDDCSPDNQVEVARDAWRSDIPSLEIVRPERNSGVWISTTLGIQRAQENGAEWVLILHADDIAKSYWIKNLLETIEGSAEHVASVCSSYDSLETNGQVKRGEHRPTETAQQIIGSPKSLHDTLLMGCWWHISGAAIRVAAYQAVGSLNPRYRAFADWDWTLRVFGTRTWSIAYLPQTLTYYRQHTNTITAQTIRTTARVEEQVEIVNRFASYLTRPEHLRWHGQQLYFTARRIVRDVMTRNGTGLKTDGRTAAVLVRSAFRHLVGRGV